MSLIYAYTHTYQSLLNRTFKLQDSYLRTYSTVYVCFSVRKMDVLIKSCALCESFISQCVRSCDWINRCSPCNRHIQRHTTISCVLASVPPLLYRHPWFTERHLQIQSQSHNPVSKQLQWTYQCSNILQMTIANSK